FVNSLVDPLQTTYYARSIASLAAQIGLPLWFVELRHQATHEELPSLGVLRGAGRQALDWLYTHYWHPLLHPSSLSQPASLLPPLPLDTLRPSLMSYKSLLKTSLRDVSQAPRLKNDLLKVYKEVERWVADNALGGKGGGGREREARERALRGVVELLVGEAGGMVPLAKKKRPTPRTPSLPTDLLALWTPLLARLDSTYSSLPSSSTSHPASSSSAADQTSDTPFTDLVVDRAVELLCAAGPSSPQQKQPSSEPTPESADSNPALADKSYALTLVAWVVELVAVEPDSAADEADEDGDEAMDGEVRGTRGRGWDDQTDAVVRACLMSGTANALALLDALLLRRSSFPLFQSPSPSSSSAGDPLAARLKPLVALLRSADSGFYENVGADEAQGRVDEMERRWKEVEGRMDALLSSSTASAPAHSTSSSARSTLSAPSSSTSTPAWPAPIPGWTARPIGSLPSGGRVEALDLAPLPAVVV
ncbi:hypothetical protein JCM6882_001744, partial [Rhodosporidiobolus microsporus]